jgi:hypothetical protein
MSGQEGSADSGAQNASAEQGSATSGGATPGAQDNSAAAMAGGEDRGGIAMLGGTGLADAKALKEVNEKFAQSIPEAYRAETWVQDVLKLEGKNQAEEFWKQTANQQKLIGQKSVPTAESTPEQWKQFYKDVLQVPENVDDYKIQMPTFAEGDKVIGEYLANSRPPEFMKGIAAIAQKHGIPPKTLQNVLNEHDALFVQTNRALLEQQANNARAMDVDFDAQATKAFGDRKQHVLSESKKLIEMVHPPGTEVRTWLDNIPNTKEGNAELIRMASVMEGFRQRFIREDGGLRTQGVSASVNPRVEAQKLMSHPAYFDDSHIEHESVRAQVLTLMQQTGIGKK